MKSLLEQRQGGGPCAENLRLVPRAAIAAARCAGAGTPWLAEQEADIHHLPDELIPKTRMHMPTIDPVLQATDMALSDVKKAASDAAEKQFLERGLKSVNGRVVELAKQIEMNRSHLQTLLKKHGIKSKDFKRRTETADSKTPA